MHEIDLRQIDLNLLVVLDVLLEERHVTRAARRLHRTQSATSHALARLRTQLDDPLLVRVGGAMRPTPRAERLAPEVRRLLQAIGRVLGGGDAWDPATASRRFAIIAPDFAAAGLPALLAMLETAGPGLRIELSTPSAGMLDDVAVGRYDLAIAPQGLGAGAGVIGEPLVEMPWVVYARRTHPAAGRWCLDAWLAHRHLIVRTRSSDRSPVDAAVSALGRRREIGPALPHFTLAPPLLARSDLLMTVPRGVLADAAERFELIALPCPVALKPLALALYRSRMAARDPALRWLRARVREAMSRTLAGSAAAEAVGG